MPKLILNIECGEKTCAKRPGEFCKYLGTRKFGSISVCMLFPTKFPQRKQNAATTELESENGWTMRCQECLDAEKK
jgi:hypothetical protein